MAGLGDQIGKVHVAIESDSSGLDAGLRDAEAKVRQTADNVERETARVSDVAGNVAKGFQDSVGKLTAFLGSITAIVGVSRTFYEIGNRIGESLFGASESASKLAAALELTFDERQKQRAEDLRQRIEDLNKELAEANAAVDRQNQLISEGRGSQRGRTAQQELADRERQASELRERLRQSREELERVAGTIDGSREKLADTLNKFNRDLDENVRRLENLTAGGLRDATFAIERLSEYVSLLEARGGRGL